MKKQRAFLKKLSKSQLEHLRIENKFTKASSTKGEPREYGMSGGHWMGAFSREKSASGGKDGQTPIVFVPKNQEDVENERKKQIGKRSKELWEVDKVICIRFEVWGERKKLLKKGQIMDFKKEQVSTFDKVFRNNPSESFFESFEVQGEGDAKDGAKQEGEGKAGFEKVELLDENHAKRWKDILDDPRLQSEKSENHDKHAKASGTRDEPKELTLWEKMFN